MILLEDYLKKQLLVFGHIMDCAGILLEKNAMNHEPTPEEMQKIHDGADEIKKNLEQMEKDAKEQVRQYGEKIANIDARNKQLMDKITANYAEFDQLKAKQAAEEIELSRIRREAEKETADLQEKQKEVANYKKQQQEELKRREKKRKDALKWCWVPGYNIYLACDYAAEMSKGKIETLQHQCDNCERAIEQLGQKAAASRNEIEKTTKKCQELSAECEKLNLECSESQKMVAEQKKQLIYWEDLQMKVSDLKSRLETGTMAPDDLMELMDTMEMFGEGI